MNRRESGIEMPGVGCHAPASHAGDGTPTSRGPKRLRNACYSTSESPQVASIVSSGRL